MPDDPKEPDPKPADDPKPDPTPDPTPDPAPDPRLDEPFDKDRALATIKAQRDSEAAAKKRATDAEAKVREYEDRDKTETQRTAEAKDAATKDAAEARQEAARLRVAIKKGLTETQAKRLVGDNEESLEKDADELLASFKTDDEQDETRRRPRERLRGGAAPSAEPEKNDPASLAAQVPRRW